MKTFFGTGSPGVWLLAIIVSLIIPQRSSAQNMNVESGSLKSLSEANGYGDLILGADTRQMPEKNFSFLDNDNDADADSCFKFKYADTTMLNFEDGLKLDLVGLRTYNNCIVNIYLFFKIEDGFKMLKALQNYFGHPTDHPGDFMYDWSSDEVNLQLRFEAKENLGVAIFSSRKMLTDVLAARQERQKADAILASAQSATLNSSASGTIRESNEATLTGTITNP